MLASMATSAGDWMISLLYKFYTWGQMLLEYNFCFIFQVSQAKFIKIQWGTYSFNWFSPASLRLWGIKLKRKFSSMMTAAHHDKNGATCSVCTLPWIWLVRLTYKYASAASERSPFENHEWRKKVAYSQQ